MVLKYTSHFRNTRQRSRGFTLIELLTVIAIMAILASMVVGLAGVVKVKRIKSTASAQIAQIVTGIDGYKNELNQYPPDNVNGAAFPNQLYLELVGMVYDPATDSYSTTDNRYSYSSAQIKTVFGVDGILNSVELGGKPDDFLPEVSPKMIGSYTTNSITVPVLIGPHIASNNALDVNNDKGSTGKFPYFNFNSSNPQQNKQSYDLWLDILMDEKNGNEEIQTFDNWTN